jgi:hypothetical protein
MDTTLLIWIELDNPHRPPAGRACPCAGSIAAKVEPQQVLRIDDRRPSPEDRRRKMIRDTEDYLSNPLSESWARLSNLRPCATLAAGSR